MAGQRSVVLTLAEDLAPAGRVYLPLGGQLLLRLCLQAHAMQAIEALEVQEHLAGLVQSVRPADGPAPPKVHRAVERSLADNERAWQALSAEFDAAANELQQCMRRIDGLEKKGDLAALERAQRRWSIVQSAMLTFLDALDTGDSTPADTQASTTRRDPTRSP